MTGGFVQLGDDFSEYLGGELRIGTTGNSKQGGAAQARARVDWFAADLLKPKTDSTLIKTGFKGVESSVFTLGMKYYFYSSFNPLGAAPSSPSPLRSQRSRKWRKFRLPPFFYS